MTSPTYTAALRAWRSRLGLTQAKAADALGVALRTFQAWEEGEYPPKTPVMLALAMDAVERQSQYPGDQPRTPLARS